MKLDVVTSREQLPALAARWDELAHQDPRDGFCRTFAWYYAWLQHIRPDAEPFVITAHDDDGRLIGLAPLCRLRYHDLGFRLDAIAWAGREVVSGDFLDFVAESAARARVVPAMLEYLSAVSTRWGVLVMGELLQGGDSHRAVHRMSETQGLPTRDQEERICPYIALPGTFDEYLNSLGSSTRYHVRRRMRDATKKGAAVMTYSAPEELVARLDTLVRLHLARWQRDDQPGTFGRPGFTAFLREIFLHPPPGASFRLYELVKDGAAVASLMTFYFGDSALYYQAGWDPDPSVAALSPGVVLMASSIRDAIENGKRYYEFLRGDEAYKTRWTKTHRTTVTVLVARSWTARRFLQVAALKDLVKAHLPAAKSESPASTDPAEPAGSAESTATAQPRAT